MKKYNCLIAGAGTQGVGVGQEKNPNKIINFAHALTEHEGFGQLYFYDKDISKAIDAAIKWDCYWVGDEFELEFEYDVAIIATPDNNHYGILKRLVEMPIKLVICEKPICENLEEAREIVELYKAKRIPLMVNYTRRFLPYYEGLKRRYEAGEFGELLSWNLDFNRGLLHSGSHMVDFIQWFFGYQLDGIVEVERDDAITDERIKADYRIWQMQFFFEKYFWQEQRFGDTPVWDYYDKSHYHIIDNAYQFLEGKEEIKCTGEDALKALEICYELMEGKK